MGRFYSTDKPTFEKDFIYEPPYQLMQSALEANQEGFDTGINNASLLSNINLNFIDDEATRQEAKRLIDTYSGKAGTIIQAMAENPTDWRKSNAELNNLKNQLSRDFQTGDIYRLQKNAEIYDKVKQHLSTLDPTIKEAAYNQLMEDYRQQGKEKGINRAVFEDKSFLNRQDLNEKFAESLINKLGGTTNKQTQDLLRNMQSSLLGKNKSGVAGYIRELMTSTVINKDEIDAALQAFINEPGNRAYMKQMQKLGLENYFKGDSDELLDWDDPTNSLSGLISRAESLKKTVTETSDKFQYDQKYGVDANLAEQKRQFNYKQLEKTIPLQERGGDLKLALTNLDNQEKLKTTLSSVLNNSNLKALFNTQQLKDLKAIEGATLDVKGVETVRILQDLMKSYGNGTNLSFIQKQIATIENTLQEIENTTHQAWTGSPDYNGDPLKLNAARVAFNNAFINTTEADFVIPVAGNDDGYKSKAGNLRDPKLQSSGVGVPGTEITVTVAPKKKGDPTTQSTGVFREYYPNIGTLAYNPLTGEPEIATASNYTQLRAATFNPSNIQEVIPNKDKFVKSKQTGTMVPTEGYGVLEINTIGYTPDAKGNYVYGKTNTGNTVYTNFKTQGAGSIAPARVTK